MKYKKLTQEQLIISLDRLTRFKRTKNKYYRVFSEIIISNLIEPKYTKKDIDTLDYKLISELVSYIINGSIDARISDGVINQKLCDYENKVFECDNETNNLLNNTINYSEAIKIIPEDCPINLKWLKTLLYTEKINKYRYPIQKVIIVEGITEEILLPIFSKLLGYDFDENGVHIIAAGGKNQVVKLYYELLDDLKLPMFILLDKDAEENIAQITPKLRGIDKIHLVSCGEFEDLLPISLLKKTINSHFKNFMSVEIKDLESTTGMVSMLEDLFKTKGLHEFKKAEFAKLVKENVSSIDDISPEIRIIIEEIININK